MIQRTTKNSNSEDTREAVKKLEELSGRELKMLDWHRVFELRRTGSESDQNADMAWGIVRFDMFEAYRVGEVKLEPLLRQCVKVLEAFDLSKQMRQRMLGEIAFQALRIVPTSKGTGSRGRPKGTRGQAWIRGLAASLVHEAAYGGLKRDRRPDQAFADVSRVLKSFGISATPRQVEDWYGQHRVTLEAQNLGVSEELHRGRRSKKIK